jgi:Mannosyltransferase (PIG-V)
MTAKYPYQRPSMSRSMVVGTVIYLVTSVPVAIGLAHGVMSHTGNGNLHNGSVTPLIQQLQKTLTRVDGKYYVEIATTGYTYIPGHQCTANFFPLYPSIVAAFATVIPVDTAWAAVIVSNASLLLAMAVMHYHFSGRLGKDSNFTAFWIVTIFGLYPPGFFMRMAYSEATFVLLAMVVLHSVHAKWPLLQQALIVGCATAARPVGVCLMVPVSIAGGMLHLSSLKELMRNIWLISLMATGLIAFMVYQWSELGDGLAFARTQDYFRIRPHCGVFEWFQKIVIFEPIWNVYTGAPPNVCGRYCGDIPFYACLAWANPLYWMLALGLICIGMIKKFVSRAEAWYGIVTLLFYYVLRGYEMGMLSQARYTVVALPIFAVMGLLLCKTNLFFRFVIVAACAIMSGVYASQFARGYGLL